MYLIPLNGDRFALVSDEDRDVGRSRWSFVIGAKKRTPYAIKKVTIDRKRVRQTLHGLIADRMGIGPIVDHKNRMGLDCRRENLRPADRFQNAANHGLRRDSTTSFKGVSKIKKKTPQSPDRWFAQIMVKGKYFGLGRFDNPEAAARVYDEWAKAALGEFAVFNFEGK